MTRSKASLKAAMEVHISEDLGQAIEAHQRMRWLLRHNEEYIDRWLGFCELPRIDLQSVIQGDLFAVIEAATELIEAEIATSNTMKSDTYEAWHRYRQCLGRIRKSAKLEDARELASAFNLVVVVSRSDRTR